MADLVYICRDGENEELRYSIRSAVTNLPHDKIWVVGGKPDWYTGPYIEVPQTLTKYQNADRNRNAAYSSNLISEDIVLMNDDFFIIKPLDRVEVFHNGPLIHTIKHFKNAGISNSEYIKKLITTRSYLKKSAGAPNPMSYELHVPMPVKKSKMLEVIKPGIASRSAYGNLNNVGGTYMDDVKYYTGKLMEHKNYKEILNTDINDLPYPYLSTSDESFEDVRGILEALFPNPSPYERI